MRAEEFNMILESTYNTLIKLTKTKGDEYKEQNIDQLYNFKKQGSDVGVDPRVVLRIFMDKHYSSITSYIKSVQNGKPNPLSESLNSRIDDMILYLILLKCLDKDLSQPAPGSAIPVDSLKDLDLNIIGDNQVAGPTELNFKQLQEDGSDGHCD